MTTDTVDPIVDVPGRLDVEDRIAGPVTFRMAGYLAVAAAGAALCVAARRDPWLAGPGGIGVLVGLAGALVRPGGRPVESWLPPIWGYRRRGRKPRVDPPSPDVAKKPRRPRQWRGLFAATLAIGCGAVAGAGLPVLLASRRPGPPPTPAPVVVPADPIPWTDCGC